MADVQPENGYSRIANELLEAIIQSDFTKRQRAILDVIFRLSYGCKGHTKCIIPEQINFRICGIGPGHIKAELVRLLSMNVIGRKKNIYWIVKDYDKWDVKKSFDKDLMRHLVHINVNSQNGNYQIGNYRKRNRKVTKTVIPELPKQELESDITTDNHSGKILPKESIKESIKKDIYTVFEFWNSLDMHHHTKLTDEMSTHVGARIKEFGVEIVCEAIENYSRILKSDKFWLTYKWTLVDFTKSLNRFETFLTFNRPFHKYLNTRKMSEAQLEVELQSMAGRHRSPYDQDDPQSVHDIVQKELGGE